MRNIIVLRRTGPEGSGWFVGLLGSPPAAEPRSGSTVQLRLITRDRESLRHPGHAAWSVREELRVLARDAIDQHP